MRIQAALSETPDGPFTLRDIDIEEPRADEILVRITAAGICHTDLSMRRNWPQERLPMVFGHEGAGVVQAVGADVTTVAPGDSVCLSYRSCGSCASCLGGHPAYCMSSHLNASGTRTDGTTPLSREGAPVRGNFFGQSSFATYALAYERNTVKVPSDLDPAVAAPLGCSVQTGAGTVLNVLKPEADATVTVFGAGGVGLTAVMAAVASGCRVIAVDPVASRRELAEELGAVASVDPSADPDVVGTLRRITDGGTHHAVDTTGRPQVIAQALDALRHRGHLALVGIGAKAEFDIMTVMAKGLHLHGVIEGDADPAAFIPRLVDLYREGKLPLDRLITRFPFTEIEDAAGAAASGAAVKPVLTFA